MDETTVYTSKSTVKSLVRRILFTPEDLEGFKGALDRALDKWHPGAGR